MSPHRLVVQLDTARLAAGLSLDGLSELSGVSKTTLSELRNGRHQPRADTIDAIAGALDFDVRLVSRRTGAVA